MPEQKRSCYQCSIISLLVITAFFALFAYFIARPIYRQRHFYSLVNRIEAHVRPLENRCPPHVHPRAWEAGCRWALTGNANVNFSLEHVSMANMERQVKKFDEYFASDPDLSLETFEWIWDRFAESGPQGKKYVEGILLPSYREETQYYIKHTEK